MEWKTIEPVDGRTPEERLIDRALLLIAIGTGEQAGRVDAFKLMKIPFAVEHALNEKGIKSFSYAFYRHNNGPISKSIYRDREALRDAGLIEGDDASVGLTKLGDQLFCVIREHISTSEVNDEVVQLVEAKARQYAACRRWEDVKKEVYALTVRTPSGEMLVGDTPLMLDVLDKIPAESTESRMTFSTPLESALTLAFTLTPEEIAAGMADSGMTVTEVFAQPYSAI